MTNPTKTRNYYSDEDVANMRRRRESGEKWRTIGLDYAASAESIREVVKYRGAIDLPVFHRTCRMPDCGAEFETDVQQQVFCCTEHRSRQLERERKGLIVSHLVCAVPECREQVWALHKPTERSRPRYCCKLHGDLHHRRIKSGMYVRLMTQDITCEVCDEALILDSHHEKFSGSKSDKTSKEHILCPTCHMRIHRGFATYKNGNYVDLTNDILTGLQVTLDMYEDNRF